MDISQLWSIGSSAINLLAMIVSIIVLGILAGVSILLYNRWRRFNQFKCHIYYKDGFGQWGLRFDKAGIFVDPKTNNKRFFMKRNNVGLNPDKVPYVQGPRDKIVYLMQTGLKNFRFLNLDFGDPELSVTIGEEDVNWGINAYERQKKLFSESKFMQLLPFMLLAFVSIIILIMFIYFFREFDTLKDLAVAFKDASNYLAQAKSGTTIIPGGG